MLKYDPDAYYKFLVEWFWPFPPQADHWWGTGLKHGTNLDMTLLLTLLMQRCSRSLTQSHARGWGWVVKGRASCLLASKKG